MYRRARYYDPQTGRFTQEDPIGLAGGLNLYGYAEGDPANLSDPSGNIPVPVITGIAGAVIGAAYGGYRYGWSGALIGGVTGGLADAGVGGLAVRVGLLPPAIWASRGAKAVVKIGEVQAVGGATAAGAAAGKTLLPKGAQLLAIVDESGQIIAQTANVTLSHGELVARQLGGVVPKGAQVVTIVKSASNGVIRVFNSRTFHGNQALAPEWVEDAILAVFR